MFSCQSVKVKAFFLHKYILLLTKRATLVATLLEIQSSIIMFSTVNKLRVSASTVMPLARSARPALWKARYFAAETQILEDTPDDPVSSSSSPSLDEASKSSKAPFMKTKLGSTGISNIADFKRKDLDDLPITFADISRAEVAIRGGVKRTTCEQSHFISELVGANVFFKNEFRQFTGSFKERGARNAILKLMRDKKATLRGCIAASAGNHALALAYHGQQLGVPVTVVMPTVAPMAKVDKVSVQQLDCCFFSWLYHIPHHFLCIVSLVWLHLGILFHSAG